MGWFGSDSPMVFKNKDDIRRALVGMSSLQPAQRQQVFGALAKELDNGGVTKLELKDIVSDLLRTQAISPTDAAALRGLLDGV